MQRERRQQVHACYEMAPSAALKSMGLAPGGRMRQEIYDDPYGWTPGCSYTGRCPFCITTSYRSAANTASGSSPLFRSSRSRTTSCHDSRLSPGAQHNAPVGS